MNDRVVVVTGSSDGIGAAIAKVFGSRGYSVYITFLSNEAGARQVAQSVESHRSEANIRQLDVRSEDSVSRLFDDVRQTYGHLDVLVNNAVREVSKPLDQASYDEWRTVLSTKLDGAFLCTRAAMPLFMAAPAPSMIALSTPEGQQPNPDYPAYGVANAGIDAFVKAMALFLPKYGARCNAVCPGPVPTSLWGPDETNDEMWTELAKNNPVGRNTTREDVAEVVYLVATEPTRMMNGNFVYVNGGNHLRPA